MNLLENLIVILLYLPILAIPIGLLFWYAFVARSKSEQAELTAEKTEERNQNPKG
jgi:cytochrome c-type biogenesis protein CcmH/NrfF